MTANSAISTPLAEPEAEGKSSLLAWFSSVDHKQIGILYICTALVFLVIGGLVLGLVPHVPRVEMDPQVIFLTVLPPLLYIAAFFTPLTSLRANLLTISSLAVGLVIASACVAAAVAHALIPGLPWPVAFLLGAIAQRAVVDRHHRFWVLLAHAYFLWFDPGWRRG